MRCIVLDATVQPCGMAKNGNTTIQACFTIFHFMVMALMLNTAPVALLPPVAWHTFSMLAPTTLTATLGEKLQPQAPSHADL